MNLIDPTANHQDLLSTCAALAIMKRACHVNCGKKSGGKNNTRRKRNKKTLPEPLLQRSIICSRCLTIWLQLVQYLKSVCLWLVQATPSVCSSPLQPLRQGTSSEDGPLSDPKHIFSRTRNAFDSNHKRASPQLPLLSNWELYLNHLPRRYNEVFENYDALYENPFYVSDTDLIKFAQAICRNLERKSVRHIVAPSGAGKTASVLPAFLQMQSWRKSTGEAGSSSVADAYVYCPFNNNGDRCHSPLLTPCQGLVDPVWLGQAYFLVCFELLMQGRYFYNFWHHLTMWVYLARAIWNPYFFVDKMKQLVNQAVGKEGKILLHIDEHFTISEVCKIRQGALALAAHPLLRMLVVTTYTEITAEFHHNRGDLQRQFVALPPLPCSYILQHNEQWKLENGARNTAGANNHALASLALLLGVLFQYRGAEWLHLPPEKKFKYYKDFNEHRRSGNIKGCCGAIAEELKEFRPFQLDQTLEELFFRLSRGIASDDEMQLENPNLWNFGVVAYENKVTLPILRMLRTDINYIWLPRTLLLDSLISKPSEIPMNKTLGYAFMFAFLCRKRVNDFWSVSRVKKSVLFSDTAMSMFCDVATDVWKDALDSFESDTLAYTDDATPDPSVDMWMKPLPQTLVLMQVTGSMNETKLQEKSAQLEQARQLVQGAFPDWTVDACMLAPNAPESMRETVGGNVKIFVRRARKWLGGMAQLLPSLAS